MSNTTIEDFNEYEQQIIKDYLYLSEESIDLERLKEELDNVDIDEFLDIIRTSDKNSSYVDISEEEMVAFMIEYRRSIYVEDSNTSYTFKKNSEYAIKYLTETLDEKGFKLFEKLLTTLCDDFKNSSIKEANTVLEEFSRTKKYSNIQKNQARLRLKIPQTLPIEFENTDSEFERARNIYELTAKLFDSSLFLLYALYKIKDNGTTNLEEIKNTYATSIKNEILNSDLNLFDDFIYEFDSTLRNGLVHGDYTYNPLKQVLSVGDTEYTIDEIQQSTNRSIRASLILSNIFILIVHIYSRLVEKVDGFELMHTDSICPECESQELFHIESEKTACSNCGYVWSREWHSHEEIN